MTFYEQPKEEEEKKAANYERNMRTSGRSDFRKDRPPAGQK
jgi:hypothetical protein